MPSRGAELVAVDTQSDRRGLDRPARSLEGAGWSSSPTNYAGKSAAEKRTEIADWLREQKADAAVLSALEFDRLDVQHPRAGRRRIRRSRWPMRSSTPTAPPTCSSRPRRSAPMSAQHLGNGVRVHERAAFESALAELTGKTVVVDPERAVAAIFEALETGRREDRLPLRDPTILPKAIKNPAEIAGQHAAQARDGAALARFLHWIDEEAPKGDVDELTASERLEAIRRESGELRDLSFDTISGAGPNGAIVHYKSSEKTNRKLETGHALSGRFGRPVSRRHHRRHPHRRDRRADRRDARPLHPRAQGPYRARHCRFSRRARAAASSTASRGSHCGRPGSITRTAPATASAASSRSTKGRSASPRSAASQGGGDEPLQAGMILSNEPGYYKTGEYGIRIENLVLVVPREIAGAEKEMLGFETLTFAPIDRRLIDVEMLEPRGTHLAQLLSRACASADRAEPIWFRSRLAAEGLRADRAAMRAGISFGVILAMRGAAALRGL